MCGNSRGNAKLRARRGRSSASGSSLEVIDLLDILMEQEGRCAYSGVVLSLAPYSEWQCSLERRDTSLGYARSNCVLICLELQNRCQWSRRKVMSLMFDQSSYASVYDNTLYASVINQQSNTLEYARVRFTMSGLIQNAKSSSRRRKAKGRLDASVFELDVKYLEYLFEKQGGRCHYSGISLGLQTSANWNVSLERLNSTLGYVEGLL